MNLAPIYATTLAKKTAIISKKDYIGELILGRGKIYTHMQRLKLIGRTYAYIHVQDFVDLKHIGQGRTNYMATFHEGHHHIKAMVNAAAEYCGHDWYECILVFMEDHVRITFRMNKGRGYAYINVVIVPNISVDNGEVVQR